MALWVFVSFHNLWQIRDHDSIRPAAGRKTSGWILMLQVAWPKLERRTLPEELMVEQVPLVETMGVSCRCSPVRRPNVSPASMAAASGCSKSRRDCGESWGSWGLEQASIHLSLKKPPARNIVHGRWLDDPTCHLLGVDSLGSTFASYRDAFDSHGRGIRVDWGKTV